MTRRGYSWIVVVWLMAMFSCGRPTADFLMERGQEHAPMQVAFTNASKGADRVEWDFGDGHLSTEDSPDHRYSMSGRYVVKLKVFNADKSDTKTMEITVKPPGKCTVELQTRFGSMTIELFDATPKHRDNFIKLVDEGLYDDLIFHRVIEGFMIQGGDPNSKKASANTPLGTGGPGYEIDAEFVEGLIHRKGALAAARMPDHMNPQKRSSGSQFYIVHGREINDALLDQVEERKGIRYSNEHRAAYKSHGGYPFLDNEYTVFGQVVEGLSVIDSIAAVATRAGDRPEDDVRMAINQVR